MAKTAIEAAISFSALKLAFRLDEVSRRLARCVSLRSRGDDEPARQYGHDADVVGDIGRLVFYSRKACLVFKGPA